MNNDQQDSEDDVIESSQVPKLRSKIRISRPNYSAKYRSKDGTMQRKKSTKHIRDNRTVSQCLRTVWKKSNKASSSTTATNTDRQQETVAAVEEPDEEYIKFATQLDQPNAVSLQAVPSVSLFAHQEDVLTRYILSETTEAQVEEQLKKLLDGFQAEYDKECRTVQGGSPQPIHLDEHGDNGEGVQPICLPSEIVEAIFSEPDGKQLDACSPPLMVDSAPFLTPSINQQITQMEYMLDRESHCRQNPVTVSSLVVDPPISKSDMRKEIPIVVKDIDPLFPRVEIREATPKPLMNVVVPIKVADNACLDLSVNKEQLGSVNRPSTAMSIDEECTNAIRKVNTYVPSTAEQHSQRTCDVLDLRVSTPWKPRSTIPPSKPPVRFTDCGTQTKRRFRHVGVQHRPMASFDCTDRNLILLAQDVEVDPAHLHQRMKSIARTCNEPIWRECELTTVFSNADPYFANLKHFL